MSENTKQPTEKNPTQLPSFFKDSSFEDRTSDKYELVIDFFISWTLRCAQEKYISNGNVYSYAKMILSKFIFDDEDYLNNKKVKTVKVWKQWNYIDLWVETEIENHPKYILIFENKMYHKLTEDQLNKYKNIANNHSQEANLIFICTRADHSYQNSDKKTCDNTGYKYFRIDLLQEMFENKEPTHNTLFDEFWFNWLDMNKINNI